MPEREALKNTIVNQDLLDDVQAAAGDALVLTEGADGALLSDGSPITKSAKGYAEASESHAVGTGADGEPSAGSSKSWAEKLAAFVTGTSLSAKEWAIGTFRRGVAGFGSAKDWASYTGGTVDNAEFSAKYRATQASRYRQTAQNAASTSSNYNVIDPDTGASTPSGVPGARKSATDAEASREDAVAAAERAEQALIALLAESSTRQIRDVLGSFETVGTTGLSATTEDNAYFGFTPPVGPHLGSTDAGEESTLVLEYDLTNGGSALNGEARCGLLFWGTIAGTTELTVVAEALLSGTVLREAREAYVNVTNGLIAGVLDNFNITGASTLRLTLTLPDGSCDLPNFNVAPGPYALTDAVYASAVDVQTAIDDLTTGYVARAVAFAVDGTDGNEVYRVTASVTVTLEANSPVPGTRTTILNASAGNIHFAPGAGVTIASAGGADDLVPGGTAEIIWAGSGGTNPFLSGDLT